MNYQKYFSLFLSALGAGLMASGHIAQVAAADQPYTIVATNQLWGTGGIDYVYADSDGRRLYVPRGGTNFVFDLDTLKLVGSVPDSGGHGVAVDAESHHGFSSSTAVSMFDTQTLTLIKHISVEGRPDGIMSEPFTKRIYVLSHNAPNVTVIDAKDGAIAGTIDLGGQPEQGASDGMGHVYIDLEDQGSLAVVDAKTMKVTAHYSLEGKGGGPGGLGLDAKNHILFAMCHDPQVCVILSADDGKIITTLPLDGRTDAGGFNPNTMEAFSSHGEGNLTIIKENSPTSFQVEQTVQTKQGGKCCTLDTKLNRIIVTTIDRTSPPPAGMEAVPTPPAAPPPAGGDQAAGGRRGGRGGRGGGPGYLDLIAVGR